MNFYEWQEHANVSIYGYIDTLVFAGAEVIEDEQFGSYQGTWLAYVFYDGKYGWVVGDFGSCSVCDAYESAFDYFFDRSPEEWESFIKEFAYTYLGDMRSSQSLLDEYAEQAKWDYDAIDMIAFISKYDETF